ncbi:MAG: tRNA uridine-5-carboxymethylaminomethyl(34) synthesis GTPase MnmE [Clostridia bacterium]|nr:tRNA uridine-5-carboxymethylaminomethyl(34) synthesis GTPase MnmE [Clostridia bacterium]
MLNDTISAVSSPRGKGGVAIIRISGKDALPIIRKIFRMKGTRPLEETPRVARLGHILAESGTGDGSLVPIDTVLVLFFPGPHSFTGEDVVEINCHGGPLLTETVYRSTLFAGARAALPGEFTRRAFLNGKINLTEAESLGLMLEAQTESQLQIASAGLMENSPLRTFITQTTESLTSLLASVYVKIDYPEEDLAEMTEEQMKAELQAHITRLQSLKQTRKTGHAVVDGIKTVLCGKTNAGKSSIYNRLVMRDAAIVTDIPGTTRDILHERISMGPLLLDLSDTAGLREAEDADLIEKIGIERSKNALKRAELILLVLDASAPLDANDLTICEWVADRDVPVAILLNKIDKGQVSLSDRLAEIFKGKTPPPPVFPVSARTGEGLDALTDWLVGQFVDGNLDFAKHAILFNDRQDANIRQALNHLQQAKEALEDHCPTDMVCSSVELAIQALGEMDGRMVNEEIIQTIFSKFCVGK